MLPRFACGDQVRVIRTIRNDGTYPGAARGALLIKCGSMGFVSQVGTFLQDQIIYAVHFIDDGDRLVGCREQELIAADEPWVYSRFGVRDKVVTRLSLAIRGITVVAAGSEGDVHKVLRDIPGGVQYHIGFPGRILLVPETALDIAGGPVD
jgi:nitrogen fixation protein NifZ